MLYAQLLDCSRSYLYGNVFGHGEVVQLFKSQFLQRVFKTEKMTASALVVSSKY